MSLIAAAAALALTALPIGKGTFTLAHSKEPIEVFTYKPKAYKGGPLVMVCHGTLRNAEEYRDHSIAMAERLNVMVAAPLFDDKRFPSRRYHRGGVLDEEGKAVPKVDWTYPRLNQIVEEIRKREGKPNLPFALIGHSAGGQFLVRMCAFYNSGAFSIVARSMNHRLGGVAIHRPEVQPAMPMLRGPADDVRGGQRVDVKRVARLVPALLPKRHPVPENKGQPAREPAAFVNRKPQARLPTRGERGKQRLRVLQSARTGSRALPLAGALHQREEVRDIPGPAVDDLHATLEPLPNLPSRGAPELRLDRFPATGHIDQQRGIPAPTLGDYHLVADEATLQALAKRLRAEASLLAVDTETTGTDAMLATLVGFSLTHRAGEAWYVPLLAPAGEPRLTLEQLQRHLGPLFADVSLPKIGHNLKYDAKVLRRAGLPLAGLSFDTMLAEWLINPDSPNLGLKNLAWARLGVQMTEITTLIGSGKEQKSMDAIPLAQVMPYAAADADMSLRLMPLLQAELEAHAQERLLHELEMPLIEVLMDMEMTGVHLDLAWLEALSAELAGRLARLEADIYELAGEPFNINSTQQLSVILFERLGLSARGVKKMQSGHYSTRAEVLESLRGSHPIVERILEHRELSKLKSTYVDALPALVHPETGRVHTSYNQVGTVTGRLSSANPNLQNIPIRTEEGRRVRRAFVAPAGWVLISADYSQVELRVMAHVSEDPGLIEAFLRGEDVHARTAAAVFGVPLSEVTYDMRRIAKAVNFGLIYGQTAYGLSGQIGVSVPKAEEFITRYFAQFPRVRAYMEQVQREAAQRGYVETLLNRRRYFPELAPGSPASVNQRQAAQRMAINTPIQGTAADIIKLAMLRLHATLREQGLQARMILQVHDELVVEAPAEEVPQAVALMRACMEGAFELRVPLKVDVETGANWEEMQPWKGA